MIASPAALAVVGCGSGDAQDPVPGNVGTSPVPGGQTTPPPPSAGGPQPAPGGTPNPPGNAPVPVAAATPPGTEASNPGAEAGACSTRTGGGTSGQSGTYDAKWVREAVEVICPQAVTPGASIEFYVSDNVAAPGTERESKFTIERLAPSPQVVKTGTVNAFKQMVTTDAQPWAVSPDWKVTYSICVPADWRSGVYRATFTSPEGKKGSVHFVVRALQPGRTSSTVVKVPFETLQAYNNWGGKCLYDHISSEGRRASRLSTRRPLSAGAPSDIDWYIVPLCLFAEKFGVALEFISGEDMQLNPAVLDPYRFLLIIGHDEYWTSEMRDSLEKYIARGGNLAVFGANTMFWRTMVAPDALGNPAGTLICEKVWGSSTDVWNNFKSEAATLGGTYHSGGYLPGEHLDLSMKANYTVYKPAHWVFEGSGLERGSKFGAEHSLLRVEVDGVDFTLDAQGNPVSTQLYGTPPTLEILAMSMLDPGWATSLKTGANAAFTIYTTPTGGTVVNAATISWANGLEPFLISGKMTPESYITRNILLRLR